MRRGTEDVELTGVECGELVMTYSAGETEDDSAEEVPAGYGCER
ncbi:hypothetical protein ACFOY2_46085 [Nonomuraea purpurea]|uniref:Uncharacterized protein n=1 Tax=Nonomuraea purpurea TaxID=1849276 RepID=A0ABV8GP14_9ACTN